MHRSDNWTLAMKSMGLLSLFAITLTGCSGNTQPTHVESNDAILDYSVESNVSQSRSERGKESEETVNSVVSKPDTQKTLSTSDPQTLNEYLSFALQHSSGLKSAFNSYRAAIHKLPQASALPDPKLNYGYFISEVETRVGPQEQKFGVAQSFPWFGTLSLREERANAEAKAEYNRFLALKNKLVFDVVKTYADLAYLHSAVSITEDTIELVKSWEKVLQERFRSGLGKHSDLVRVQVELGKLEDRIAEFRDLITPMEASFNALLNRDSRQSVQISKVEKVEDLFGAENVLASDNLSIQNVLSGNPELGMFDALTEAREKGVSLAEKKYYPDFTLGVDYVVVGDRDAAPGGGEDAVMSMISINVPIYWEKNRAAVNEAKRKQRSIEEMRKDKEYMLRSDFSRAQFDLRDSKRKIVLFKNTLIPKAEESIEASYTAYESGEVGFLDVLDSEQRLLDFQLSLSRAHSNEATAIAKLFRLAGDYSELSSLEEGDSK